jgi:hypothetical protein
VKRVLAALAGTVAGLAGLLSYKSGPTHKVSTLALGPAPTQPSAAPPTAAPTVPPGNGGGDDQSQTGDGGGQPSATPPPTSPPPTAAPLPAGSKVVKGQDVPNQYGDVQVQVTIQGGKIVDVAPLLLPVDRQRSAYISQVAGPMLRTEVLQAQSANIDIISGATYTSQSYAQSVQSALDQARQ